MQLVREDRTLKESKSKLKRGRPRQDFSQHVGYVGPLGLIIEGIRETGPRAREGPHVDAVCLRCGEHSKPRLRDVLSGHSKSGGCRKKECFLAFCDRVVAGLDESVPAGVWACRYAGMTRTATAAKFNLAYPIADAALRKYQTKLDAMIAEGVAEKIHEQASQPHWDIVSAAGRFSLTPEAGRYLTFNAKNRMKAAKAGATRAPQIAREAAKYPNAPVGSIERDAQEHISGCASNAAWVVEKVEKRRNSWSVARPGELSKEELKKIKGEPAGKLAWLYSQCSLLLEDITVPPGCREDIQMFVDLANSTLDNRRGRQIWARDKAIREKQRAREGPPQELPMQYGFSESEDFDPHV